MLLRLPGGVPGLVVTMRTPVTGGRGQERTRLPSEPPNLHGAPEVQAFQAHPALLASAHGVPVQKETPRPGARLGPRLDQTPWEPSGWQRAPAVHRWAGRTRDPGETSSVQNPDAEMVVAWLPGASPIGFTRWG